MWRVYKECGVYMRNVACISGFGGVYMETGVYIRNVGMHIRKLVCILGLWRVYKDLGIYIRIRACI